MVWMNSNKKIKFIRKTISCEKIQGITDEVYYIPRQSFRAIAKEYFDFFFIDRHFTDRKYIINEFLELADNGRIWFYPETKKFVFFKYGQFIDCCIFGGKVYIDKKEVNYEKNRTS